MNNRYIWLSFLFASLLFVGLISENPHPALKATNFEGGIELNDSENRIIESYFEKNSFLSEDNRVGLCIAAPKGTRITRSYFWSDYQVIVESIMISTPPIVSGCQGVTISVSGILTGSALILNTKEKEDPHNEEQPKAVLVRNPLPPFLPPKRISIQLSTL